VTVTGTSTANLEGRLVLMVVNEERSFGNGFIEEDDEGEIKKKKPSRDGALYNLQQGLGV
jgi:hypothetical protein